MEPTMWKKFIHPLKGMLAAMPGEEENAGHQDAYHTRYTCQGAGRDPQGRRCFGLQPGGG